MDAYTFTGTRCSGPGYGYAFVQHTDGRYGVVLSWQGMHRLVWQQASAYDTNIGDEADIRQLAYRFADLGRAWHVYTSRQRALANGIAVIGGC